MSKISWIIFTVVIVGVFGLLLFFSNNQESSAKLNVDEIDTASIQLGNESNGNISDHIYGNKDSKVTLIEYADYQCPGCGTSHDYIKTIVEEYKDQIQYVYRNFLLEYHNNARAAASAAEASGLQEKFWEMHHRVFDSQKEWELLTGQKRTDKFISYAKELNLDIDKFLSDMSSKEISMKLDYDYALGKKADLDATPSFYLNGKKLEYEIWSDNKKLRNALNTELEKAGISLPDNT
ncbi:MAG TPA: thioredoxin domain-containing protein [Candidatus Saccharibacteria bacterium]|nr:thioredoxin domain-containing protein [Candidatus Saccharibacteria bacterium]